jgi:hypothetical protein
MSDRSSKTASIKFQKISEGLMEKNNLRQDLKSSDMKINCLYN